MEAKLTQPKVRLAGLPAMNALLYVAAFLVFSVGITLTLFTEQTETLFAWTIAPPNNVYLTAAFLGASYWASCVLEFLAARRRAWTHSRIAVPAVVLFTFLTLIVTLLHLDRFHLTPPSPPSTIGMTYFWLFVYVSVPLLMSALLVLELRKRRPDGPRTQPIPVGLKVALGLQSAVMLVFGLLLLFAPQTAPSVWPWKLTPLTAQAIGAWLVSLPVAGFHMIAENDLDRVKPSTVSYIALGVLQLIALARYPGDLNWSTPGAWLYLFFLLGIVLVGGLLAARTLQRV
jgi:hypothetical protein